MKVNEILTEGRDAPLYHNLSSDKAEAVFSNDSIPGLWEHDLPGMGRVRGNSFTRNRLYRDGYPVQLVVDQAKLAQTHKIIPVNAELIHRMNMANHLRRSSGKEPLTIMTMPADALDRHKHVQNQMSEEFVVGDINNLHQYVTKIILYKGIGAGGMHFLNEYAKKFKIPLIMNERMKKIMTSTLRALGKQRHQMSPIPHPVASRQAYFDKYHGNVPSKEE